MSPQPKIKKLKIGDHIRVLSPSSSIARVGGFDANLSAKTTLENLGFRISFSQHYLEYDQLGSASIASRVADLHDAFSDPDVDMILATIGGFNSNELLPYLDYELIAKNPKIICGYSDTTAILTAIFAKTGMMTYMGANYTGFKMRELQDYQSRMWLQALTQHQYRLTPSAQWSSDAWYLPDATRQLFDTKWQVYHHGQASGVAIGGNLSTFALLNGTPYAPNIHKIKDYVLFLESSESHDHANILRQLTSVLQVYSTPKALLLGRFPKECQMSDELLTFILDKFPLLKTIPVMTHLDFAHTQPLFTFAIGGQVKIDTHTMTIEFVQG